MQRYAYCPMGSDARVCKWCLLTADQKHLEVNFAQITFTASVDSQKHLLEMEASACESTWIIWSLLIKNIESKSENMQKILLWTELRMISAWGPGTTIGASIANWGITTNVPGQYLRAIYGPGKTVPLTWANSNQVATSNVPCGWPNSCCQLKL